MRLIITAKLILKKRKYFSLWKIGCWKGGCRSLGDPGQGSIAIMINRAIKQLLQTVADPLVPDMLNNQYADMLIYTVSLKLKYVSMLH